MKHPTSEILFAAALFVTANSLAVGAPEKQPESQAAKQADPAAYVGLPVTVVIEPEVIRLTGRRDMRQILVTGRYADGSERDLTSFLRTPRGNAQCREHQSRRIGAPSSGR